MENDHVGQFVHLRATARPTYDPHCGLGPQLPAGAHVDPAVFRDGISEDQLLHRAPLFDQELLSVLQELPSQPPLYRDPSSGDLTQQGYVLPLLHLGALQL